MDEIARDPAGFAERLDDRDARGGPVFLPDGSVVTRLPGYRRWMMDGGAFCGTIGFRWQHGTSALPAHVLGHIGYAVVPWLRGRGCATRALALLLREISDAGLLPHVELTTSPDNLASQGVILANGGEAVGEFTKSAAYGGGTALRWRIAIQPAPGMAMRH